jgi:hypothetical protein
MIHRSLSQLQIGDRRDNHGQIGEGHEFIPQKTGVGWLNELRPRSRLTLSQRTSQDLGVMFH